VQYRYWFVLQPQNFNLWVRGFFCLLKKNKHDSQTPNVGVRHVYQTLDAQVWQNNHTSGARVRNDCQTAVLKSWMLWVWQGCQTYVNWVRQGMSYQRKLDLAPTNLSNLGLARVQDPRNMSLIIIIIIIIIIKFKKIYYYY
jgi:hypothetical protein